VDRKPNERSVAVYVCMGFGQVKHKVAVCYKEHIKIYHPSSSLKCTSEWLTMQYASLSVLHGSNFKCPHHAKKLMCLEIELAFKSIS